MILSWLEDKHSTGSPTYVHFNFPMHRDRMIYPRIISRSIPTNERQHLAPTYRPTLSGCLLFTRNEACLPSSLLNHLHPLAPSSCLVGIRGHSRSQYNQNPRRRRALKRNPGTTQSSGFAVSLDFCAAMCNLGMYVRVSSAGISTFTRTK